MPERAASGLRLDADERWDWRAILLDPSPDFRLPDKPLLRADSATFGSKLMECKKTENRKN
jgi:hypothetical protein